MGLIISEGLTMVASTFKAVMQSFQQVALDYSSFDLLSSFQDIFLHLEWYELYGLVLLTIIGLSLAITHLTCHGQNRYLKGVVIRDEAPLYSYHALTVLLSRSP